jgi:hypothetical protein
MFLRSLALRNRVTNCLKLDRPPAGRSAKPYDAALSPSAGGRPSTLAFAVTGKSTQEMGIEVPRLKIRVSHNFLLNGN